MSSGAGTYGCPPQKGTVLHVPNNAAQSPGLRTHRAGCLPGWQAVVHVVVVSHIIDTRSRHAYRFALSHTRYSLIVPTIVMRNRLCTAHPSLQGESVAS